MNRWQALLGYILAVSVLAGVIWGCARNTPPGRNIYQGVRQIEQERQSHE